MEVSKFQCIKSPREVINSSRKLILLTEPPAVSKNTPRLLKNAQVIDLSDKKVKMALHRQFSVDEGRRETEHSLGELSYCVKMTDNTGQTFLLPKLPPGTILMRQSSNSVPKVAENSMTRRFIQTANAQTSKHLVQPEKNK